MVAEWLQGGSPAVPSRTQQPGRLVQRGSSRRLMMEEEEDGEAGPRAQVQPPGLRVMHSWVARTPPEDKKPAEATPPSASASASASDAALSTTKRT
eukprot:1343813-Rhodomonas_salina.1